MEHKINYCDYCDYWCEEKRGDHTEKWCMLIRERKCMFLPNVKKIYDRVDNIEGAIEYYKRELEVFKEFKKEIEDGSWMEDRNKSVPRSY